MGKSTAVVLALVVALFDIIIPTHDLVVVRMGHHHPCGS
jgi:hypothetical protein